MKHTLSFLCFAVVFFAGAVSTTAQPESESASSDTVASAVAEIYRLVSFEAGTRPSWEKLKSFFVDDAVIVLRTSRTQLSILSVDGFVQDFVNFIEKAGVDTTGFVERIVNLKPTVFGDIAHCFVVYEASIPGRPLPPQRGVDSFQLIRKNGVWRIISIINEVPEPGQAIPTELM